MKISLRRTFKMVAGDGKLAPKVIVSIGDNNPDRGDIHGAVGVARLVAARLGGAVEVVDSKKLAALYPGDNYEDKLKRHLRAVGKPDLLFTATGARAAPETRGGMLIVSSVNETLSKRYLGHTELVSHHLTPEMLKAEGVAFRAQYAGLARPITAVLLGDLREVEPLSAQLAAACAREEQGTIFLCSSPRTSGDLFDQLAGALRKHAGPGIGVEVFNLNRAKASGRAFCNPYVGLIDQADHFVVAGESLSIISEVLAAGKTLYVAQPKRPYPILSGQGVLKFFGETEARQGLSTRAIAPVCAMEQIAEKLLVHVEEAKASRWLKLLPWRSGGPVNYEAIPP